MKPAIEPIFELREVALCILGAKGVIRAAKRALDVAQNRIDPMKLGMLRTDTPAPVTTRSRAANTPPSPSASAAGDGAWSRRWARSGTASTTPWPRASSPPSNANCSTARTSTTPGQAGGRLITRRAEPSSSSSRDGITPIVVTKASVNNPRWPSRGATRTLHETQALLCPLKRGNSNSLLPVKSSTKRRKFFRQPAFGSGYAGLGDEAIFRHSESRNLSLKERKFSMRTDSILIFASRF